MSIVGAGLPVAMSYGAMGLEFSVAQLMRAGWRYWRQPRRFLAGQPTAGYVVLSEPLADTPSPAGGVREGEPLWDV